MIYLYHVFLTGCVVQKQKRQYLIIGLLDFPLIEKMTLTYTRKSEYKCLNYDFVNMI